MTDVGIHIIYLQLVIIYHCCVCVCVWGGGGVGVPENRCPISCILFVRVEEFGKIYMLRRIVFLFLKTKNLKIIYDGGTLAISAYFFEKQFELMRPFQKTKYWL